MKRSLSQPHLRPEAEAVLLQEVGELPRRADSEGMASGRAGSAVGAHSEHDLGVQGPIWQKASFTDDKSPRRMGLSSAHSKSQPSMLQLVAADKNLLSAANSRGASPRRVESTLVKSPRRTGSSEEKMLLQAANSRGASPRRDTSPQKSFSASSGSLFYANMYVQMSCAAESCGVGTLCVSVDEGVLFFALIWLCIWLWCPAVVAGD